jgi:hypothetical protein
MKHIKPEKLDMLLAFKAIALTDDLSGIEKSVAAAIVDSFNHKTTQCDPSLNRIAHLLGRSRRTVIRAVLRIERIRFVRKYRHGGHSHRNSYEPNWTRYREIENAWAARKKTRHWESSATELSPRRSQTSHLDGAVVGTQTFLINQSNKPVGPFSNGADLALGANGHSVLARNSTNQADGTVHASDAARLAAERRWSTGLHNTYSGCMEAYAKVIEAIDANVQSAATDAEMRKRGAGLQFIIDRLGIATRR